MANKKPEPTVEEQIKEVKADYPEMEIIEIEKMGQMGDSTFIWYENPTIKETVIEHQNRRGWIPARIFVDKRGHYIPYNENKLKPDNSSPWNQSGFGDKTKKDNENGKQNSRNKKW